MTPEQFDRWKDFALRMARTCYAKNRRPSCQWIVDVLEDFFDRLDQDEIETFESWCKSGVYTDGRREGFRGYCQCGGQRHHTGSPLRSCPECFGTGAAFNLQTGPLVCDRLSVMLDDSYFRVSFRACPACSHECRRQWPHNESACTGCDLTCSCDEIEDRAYQQWDEQFGGPVRCCLRAGLDVAGTPSDGVIGFTVGDLRRMYPEGLPDWLTAEFEPDMATAANEEPVLL